MPAINWFSKNHEGKWIVMESIVGYLEEITATKIEGWLYDKCKPDTPVEIVAFSDSIEIGRAWADRYRADLHAAGIGNGRHSFSIDIKEFLDRSTIRFFVGGTQVSLTTAWEEIAYPAGYLLSSPPPPYAFNSNRARQLLGRCLREHTSLSVFRLIGLMDAVCRFPDKAIRNVLSVGCGEGLHEKYLSLCNWQANVLAIDVEMRAVPEPYENITFHKANILEWRDGDGQFDFVFSIECLEHIPEFETAFTAIVNKVKNGGYIYISVPFANESERADKLLCQEEFESHEHVTPGFSVELVEKMCADNNLEICFIEGMFFTDVILPFRRVLDSLDAKARESLVNDLYMLASADVKRKIAKNRKEGLGIRFLARKNNI